MTVAIHRQELHGGRREVIGQNDRVVRINTPAANTSITLKPEAMSIDAGNIKTYLQMTSQPRPDPQVLRRCRMYFIASPAGPDSALTCVALTVPVPILSNV